MKIKKSIKGAIIGGIISPVVIFCLFAVYNAVLDDVAKRLYRDNTLTTQPPANTATKDTVVHIYKYEVREDLKVREI